MFQGRTATSRIKAHSPRGIVKSPEQPEHSTASLVTVNVVNCLVKPTNGSLENQSTLDGGLTPIVCIGETLEEREANQTMDVVSRQLLAVLDVLSEDEVAKMVLAYEPIWAIGTGRTASPEQAQEVHASLREVITRHSGSFVADRLRIQYGGSVKPQMRRTF